MVVVGPEQPLQAVATLLDKAPVVVEERVPSALVHQVDEGNEQQRPERPPRPAPGTDGHPFTYAIDEGLSAGNSRHGGRSLAPRGASPVPARRTDSSNLGGVEEHAPAVLHP